MAQIVFTIAVNFARAVKNSEIPFRYINNAKDIDLDADYGEARNPIKVAQAIGGDGTNFDPRTDRLLITFAGNEVPAPML